ncbi:predicted protein [Plenodomus lingam JN3]|uniref:Predicted protein n=1 Tax=Leptosphaeria maculans (strain JN3 / isolate v23.1.3 / race Av1-4-5-6-7-8) TaxID=985895 RepID=E5A4V2_LEPMJ|nr:predicted protein [Plenodomus lingam JN3]CBX98650.1 predicted protein [Plenodomus lingam JN3]
MASRKRSRFLSLLPGVHWTPTDISPRSTNQPRSPSQLTKTNQKQTSRVSCFVRAHDATTDASSSSTSKPTHHTPRPRKPTLRLPSKPTARAPTPTHAQAQSPLFAKLPLELRRMVYEGRAGKEGGEGVYVSGLGRGKEM